MCSNSLCFLLAIVLAEHVKTGSALQCRLGDKSDISISNITTETCQHSCFNARLKLNVYYSERKGNSFDFWNEVKIATVYSCNEFLQENCTAKIACDYLTDEFTKKIMATHHFDVVSCQGNCCTTELCNEHFLTDEDNPTSSNSKLTPKFNCSALLSLCMMVMYFLQK